MERPPSKVLVLCTGNSCRSVMVEAIINEVGHGRYQAWSAGSHPAGYVHPKAVETLKRHGIDPGMGLIRVSRAASRGMSFLIKPFSSMTSMTVLFSDPAKLYFDAAFLERRMKVNYHRCVHTPECR